MMATRRDNSYWRTKHERIAEAAFDEFSKKGFDLASMEKIAESAGVSKVTVYNHFATKDQLFIDCCEYFFEFMFRPFEFDPEQIANNGTFSLELFILAVVEFSLNPKLLAMRNMMRSEYARMAALGSRRKETDLAPTQLIGTLCQLLPMEEKRRKDIAELILSLVLVKCQNHAEVQSYLNLPLNSEESIRAVSREINQIVDGSGLIR